MLIIELNILKSKIIIVKFKPSYVFKTRIPKMRDDIITTLWLKLQYTMFV